MILRFFVSLAFLLAMGAALGSYSLFTSLSAEREARLESENKLAEIQESTSAAKNDLEQYQSRLSDMETQIATLKSSENDLKAKLDDKSAQSQALETELESKNSEILKLTEQLESYRKKERVAPAPVVKTVTPPSATPAGAVTPVQPPKTVVPPVIPAEAPATDDNRILTVNRKFNFIVVNLGLKDGLRMGDKVEVIQSGKQKALAQIEKIYDKFSAATLLSEDKGNPVHEGDAVRKV